MLDRPSSGWVNIKIGNFHDRASYLTDVAIDCLKAFANAFNNDTPAVIKFDAEGWEYMIVSDNYDTHIISDNCDMGYLYQTEMVSKLELANEIIKDVEKYIDEWSMWIDDNEMDIAEKKYDLKRNIEWLKKAIRKKTI